MRFSKAMITIALLTGILGLVTGCLPDSTSSVNQRPSAELTASPNSGAAPLEVTFNGSNSYDPDGIIISYKWNFGDGSLAKDETATHTYELPGTYVVVLEVTDDDGGINQTASAILVFESSTSPVPDEPPPSVIRFEGYDSSQSVLPIPSGARMTFFMEYVGGYKFSVVLLDALHQRVAQLADEDGDFEGRKDYNGGGNYQGPFFLDVVAVGSWAITTFDNYPVPFPSQSYTGHGQRLSQYSSLFTLEHGSATFYYSGSGATSVVLLDYHRLNWVALLVDENESFDGRKTIEIEGSGTYLLKIRASGDWRISVEQ
jgi:PKD repeat protein